MKEKKYVKQFRIVKFIELLLLIIFQLVVITVLLLHPEACSYIYTDKLLFSVCGVFWLSSVIYLIFLLYDFIQIKAFAVENHELSRVAYLDKLTGIPNRHGLDAILKTYDSQEALLKLGCYMATIDNLGQINDKLGRKYGDKAIQDFCNMLEAVGDKYGTVARNGGNDFVMIMNNATDFTMSDFLDDLHKQIEKYNYDSEEIELKIKDVFILNCNEKAEVFTTLLTSTYTMLHS